MTTRRVLQPTLISLAALSIALACAPLFAQDTSDVENAKFQITGLVNAGGVLVRSGPSDNDYATMKLDKGAEITVVGERFNWLKILPPEGSFCYVAKAYVNRAGNGSIGVVTSALFVRVGSALNPLKTKVAMKLEPSQRVEIVGEQDEYFKIKPPPGTYLYINKQFVDPVRTVNPTAQTDAAAPAADQAPEAQPADMPAAAGATPPGDATEASAEPQTDQQPQSADATAATPPATQPTVEAEAEFDRLEKEYSQISQQSLEEQPVEDLLAGYQKLAATDGLPESMRRICDFKANVLKGRAEVKAQYVGAIKIQEDMKQKHMALRSEQEELEQRVKQSDVRFYTAVGTLRTSSLQQGQQTLYRLTDPANGRTVVYLRTSDPKLGQLMGQFIGVRGEVTTDAQLNLRSVEPTAVEVVNPANVGTRVASQIVPPSLMPAPTARTE